MANAYSQIYMQVVFAVEARQHLIPPEFKEAAHNYLAGIISERHQKLLAVHYQQPEHHAQRSLRQEYMRFLQRFEIEHDERFLFRDVSQ